MLRRIAIVAALTAVLTFLITAPTEAAEAAWKAVTSLELLKGWEIQSSCEIKAGGEQVSRTDFATAGWHKTTVPNTVVGALVDDKTYPDPTYGTNMKNLPGMNYSTNTFFANQDMPDGSPFKCAWWWRNEFVVPASFAKKNVSIHFPGINYRANVWLNGQKIGDSKEIAGTYRIIEFDLTKLVKAGAKNVIALEISAPAKEDLGITWVDWNPTPADKNLGIWKEVTLTARGSVAIRNPFVKTQLNSDFTMANLTVSADLRNDSNLALRGALVLEIEGKTLKLPVELKAAESKTVRMEPE